MAGVDKSSPLREALTELIYSINEFAVPLEPKNQVLIVISLDTEEKIIKFNRWIKKRLTGENDLQATETEIVRAAVQIGKGIL